MPTAPPAGNDGLVRPWEGNRSFILESCWPSPALERLVDRHWIVRWDLRGHAPFRQEILPHPSVNLVVEPQGASVWGVPTCRDVRLLHGREWAVGTKFKPGAFTAITGISAATITDRSVPVPACLGSMLDPIAIESTDEHRLDAAVTEIERRLALSADVQDPAFELVGDVIRSMQDLEPDACVGQIAARHHLAPRTLQRLFRQYVGVSPKWVLKRLRIHHAVEHLAGARAVPWTRLALELGYYDHAHFIRDFRLVVGLSPAEYAWEAQSA